MTRVKTRVRSDQATKEMENQWDGDPGPLKLNSRGTEQSRGVVVVVMVGEHHFGDRLTQSECKAKCHDGYLTPAVRLPYGQPGTGVVECFWKWAWTASHVSAICLGSFLVSTRDWKSWPVCACAHLQNRCWSARLDVVARRSIPRLSFLSERMGCCSGPATPDVLAGSG